MTIYEKDGKTTQKQNTVLKCTLVNLDNDVNRYLIPSKYVFSNSTIVDSLASFLTMDNKNDFEKANTIFDYITNEIQLTTNNKVTNSSDYIIENKKANELEINLTLCAILEIEVFLPKSTSQKQSTRRFTL